MVQLCHNLSVPVPTKWDLGAPSASFCELYINRFFSCEGMNPLGWFPVRLSLLFITVCMNAEWIWHAPPPSLLSLIPCMWKVQEEMFADPALLLGEMLPVVWCRPARSHVAELLVASRVTGTTGIHELSLCAVCTKGLHKWMLGINWRSIILCQWSTDRQVASLNLCVSFDG